MSAARPIKTGNRPPRQGDRSPLLRKAIYVAVLATLSATVIANDQIPAQQPDADNAVTGPGEATKGKRAREQVSFDAAFLTSMGGNADLTDFNNDISVKPGPQRVSIKLNESAFGTETVLLKKNPASDEIEPCIAASLLLKTGVDAEKLAHPLSSTDCAFIADVIPGATAEYDAGEQTLDLTIPQAYLKNTARGYVSPDRWDEGVPAAAFSYALNASNMRQDDQPGKSYYYGSLHSSINLGPWRLRTNGSITGGSGQPASWTHSSAYVERAIASLQAQAVVGDRSTTGQLFDTVSVRGVSLLTDDRMVPESQRGYAPVVRGVARTNALVTVTQNGNALYQTSVPPGEFVIDDLYATGYGGDILVNIKESDGSEQNYTVPYSSLPQLLRAGYAKFSTTLGKVRDEAITDAPMLFESTYQKGVSNDVTLYTGVQLTNPNDYAALVGGVAVNTWLGALGMDLTKSYSFFDRSCYPECKSLSGLSARVSLGKLFPETGTYFALMAYRYSSEGYYSLSESLQLKEAYRSNDMSKAPANLKDRFEVNVTQSLGEHGGSLYASGYYGRRWQEAGSSTSFQAGYSNSWGPLRYTLSASRTDDAYGQPQNGLFASLSVPLGRAGSNQPSLQIALGNTNTETDARASVTGTTGSERQYNYNGWFEDSSKEHVSFGAGTGYTGSAGSVSASYGQSRASRTMAVNAGGGVVVHGGGINFTPQLGETIAIVKAEGATGASVLPEASNRVAKNGYAVIANLLPYQINNLDLDLKGADIGVQVEGTHEEAIPTAGAAVAVDFKTRASRVALIRALLTDGKPVPFGAVVKDADENMISAVGQGGQVFINDFEPGQVLRAVWGTDPDASCLLDMTPLASLDAKAASSADPADVACTLSPPAAQLESGIQSTGSGKK